jgi:peptide-methionine (S)-S-oxide reductase
VQRGCRQVASGPVEETVEGAADVLLDVLLTDTEPRSASMLHRRLYRLAAIALPVALAIAATRPAPALATTPPGLGIAARDTAVFAGGCFWGVEAVFARVKGVTSSMSGYAGGRGANPSYENVSTGTTGYAESVRVIYDPAVVTYDQLLAVFFAVAHDPTELNRQGPDEGTQYRSAIFFQNAEQQRAASAYVTRLAQMKKYSRPIVTQLAPLTVFYPAEAYHQRFFDTHPDYPYIVINDKPKVEHLRQQFPQLYVAR